MQKFRIFLFYWLPVLLWMTVIFGFSSDSHSFQHSSRIIGPLLDWLFPGMASDTRNEIVFIARKGAHLTVYAILVLLVWRAWRRRLGPGPHPWTWREAGLALFITALYAASDEYHQTFVPTRDGCVRDVIIDSCGAAAALWLLWLLGRRLKRW